MARRSEVIARRSHGNLRDRRSFGNGAEILLHLFLDLVLVEVSDDCQGGVIWRVVLAEKVAHIFEFRGFDVNVRSNHGRIVGMVFREQFVVETFFHQSIRRVLRRLTPFIAHHVALVRQVLNVQFAGQVGHAVAFQPQRQIQLVGRHRFVIVGAVEIRGAIDFRGTRRLQVAEMRLGANVLRSLEHHVFKKMREAGAPGFFIGRARRGTRYSRRREEACDLPKE